MKTLLIMYVSLFLWDPVLASMNPLPSVICKKCNQNGNWRLQGYTNEMLVGYSLFQLDSCIKGNPGP
ncbi:beta-defensin 134 [Trichechus manatus latirostris]|uniref:Beta-defensin 134 n=1 Tax=Trichechus manatus latirostris TaxID=127582 RepID=A0A2Y9RAU4_TRIMA|nr:beta-defensin 134 [Trichechus manatus latirostris]